ncbi:MAG TPA: glucose-6-phosphate isomerase, partial [Desulfuromonadaceae bacterium]
IALFERAVGLYAGLININAYHQPGVEAGKKAAGAVIARQRAALDLLRREQRPMTAGEIAAAAGTPGESESMFVILRHLAANPDRGVEVIREGAVSEWRFQARQ